MAFMNFEAFLHARNDLRFCKISTCKSSKKRRYFLYEIETLQGNSAQKFEYLSLDEHCFLQDDEILFCNQGKKIILFKNFTQDKNNFKEANLRHFSFVLLLFVALCCFGTLCVMNGFLGIDIAFFMFFTLLFVLSLINFSLLKKQMRILGSLSKEQALKFLEKQGKT